METQDIYEIWDKESDGVLTVEPLILTVCREGKAGSVFAYPGGCIYKTFFTYLCGIPDEDLLSEHPDLLYENRLVCMSPEWADYVRRQPVRFILRRELMEPYCQEPVKKPGALPDGYTLSPFTRGIFEAHPFDHGRGYRDHQDFTDRGAGAAVLYDGQVVSAASSFLTYEGHVELDVFTEPEHRGRGLAGHCVFEMLRQCSAKKYTVHWDAQNRMSSRMAKSHGFVPLTDYAVYWIDKP